MNTDDLENKLRELKPRRPSAGFAERVLAQRPEDDEVLRKHVPWWRRRIAIPVPALAGLLALFILIQIAQWHLTRPRPNAMGERSATAPVSVKTHQPDAKYPTVTVASANAETLPQIVVSMTGNCTFHLNN